jgi:hypothetical protein
MGMIAVAELGRIPLTSLLYRRKYKNGASADSPPSYQYCYWMSGPLGNTTAHAHVDIAQNGEQLANIPERIPNLDKALDKCVWWGGRPTQKIASPKPLYTPDWGQR